MITDLQRYETAIARFDEANGADPNRERAEDGEHPRELLYARRMSAMLERYAPDAPEAVRLAARCHHLRRWEIPRASYPMDRAGYKEWRTRLMRFHADLAGSILRDVGYDDEMVGHVQALVRKEGLKVRPETQLLEDIIALVFLESYLAEFVARHAEYEEARLIDILRKTAQKMSARGREAALTLIRVPSELQPVLRKAVAPA